MMKKKGSILVFTLWVLAILAILSIIVSRRASTDVRLARYEADSIKASYLAKAGVMKMLAELAKDTNTYDSLNEDWNRTRKNPKELILMGNRVLYGASDESSRFNLNSSALKKEELVSFGIDGSIAQKILDYKNNKGSKGFEFIEELFLVDGMTKGIFSILKDFFTIYRGTDPVVNINTADHEVLNAITGSGKLVEEILDYREGPDGEEGTEDDGIFRGSSDITMIQGLDPSLFTVSSNVFRIWAEAFLKNDKDVKKNIEAVVDRRSGKIYHWKEE